VRRDSRAGTVLRMACLRARRDRRDVSLLLSNARSG
jgi:hypothetical protein